MYSRQVSIYWFTQAITMSEMQFHCIIDRVRPLLLMVIFQISSLLWNCIYMTMYILTPEFWEDSEAGKTHSQVFAGSGGKRQFVRSTGATTHSATSLAVVSPDHETELLVTTHAGDHAGVRSQDWSKLLTHDTTRPLQHSSWTLTTK